MIQPIVLYSQSHNILNTKVSLINVEEDDKNDVSSLISDMKETLESIGGLGLAANQIGRNQAVCLVKINENLITMINPQIVSHSTESKLSIEGCLSLPDISAKINRYETVSVKFINPDFSWREDEMFFDFPNSVVVQHEIDHLNGKLMIDSLSPMQKNLISTKLKRVSRGNTEINYVGMIWRDTQKSWSLVGPYMKLMQFYSQFQKEEENLTEEPNKTE